MSAFYRKKVHRITHEPPTSWNCEENRPIPDHSPSFVLSLKIKKRKETLYAITEIAVHAFHCPFALSVREKTVSQSSLFFLAPDLWRRGPEGKARMFPASSCVVIVLSRPSVLGDMEGTVQRPCKYIFSAALTLVWGGFEKLKCCTYHISPACRDPKLVGGTIHSTFLFVVPRGLRIDWLRDWGTRIFQLPFWTKSRNFFLSFIECVIQKAWLLGSFYF